MKRTSRASESAETTSTQFTEVVEVAGHIIDSLLLPKILDEISSLGGEFVIQDVQIGHHRSDPSHARLQVIADSPEQLEEILALISRHGAIPVHQQDCNLVAADMDGAFPEDFYSTTNQDTEIRGSECWLPESEHHCP